MFGAGRDFPVTPAVTAGAYSSGEAVGNLQTVGVLRSDTGASGILNSFWLASKSGQTPTITVYIFSAKPTGSTFTDTSNSSLAAADVAKLVIPPFALTLVAPTGTSSTFAGVQGLGVEFANQDSPTTNNLYVALVSGSSFTPGSTSDIVFKLGVVQD